MTGPRIVTLDAVGTLIRPRGSVGEIYAAVARPFGTSYAAPELDDRFRRVFAQHEDRACEGDLRSSEELERERWKTIVGEVIDDVSPIDDCFDALFRHFAEPDAWALCSDVPETLDDLKERGVRVAIASNFDDRLQSIAAGVPALAGIDPLLYSSRLGHRKPHPRFFLNVLGALGAEPRELIHVGDDPRNDVEGARSAGIDAVRLSRGGPAGPGVIRSLRELSDIVG